MRGQYQHQANYGRGEDGAGHGQQQDRASDAAQRRGVEPEVRFLDQHAAQNQRDRIRQPDAPGQDPQKCCPQEHPR